MKKIAVSFIVLLIGLLPVLCAYADSITPYAAAENSISASVSVSGTSGAGKALVRFPPGYSANTTIYVQEKTNGAWTIIARSSGTTSVVASFSARSGASYRVFAETTIINSATNESEKLTTYSPVVTN